MRSASERANPESAAEHVEHVVIYPNGSVLRIRSSLLELVSTQGAATLITSLRRLHVIELLYPGEERALYAIGQGALGLIDDPEFGFSEISLRVTDFPFRRF